jgi:predicted SprT family Zn-dependent metalloprotease
MNDFEVKQKLRSIYLSLSQEYDFHYHCPLDAVDIVISTRLRSCNGNILIRRNPLYEPSFSRKIANAKITMSRALLNEFGWDSFETTFRHEVAHLADTILHNGRGHGTTFKRLCQKFGGTMNQRMAGFLYADCAETNYVKPITKWIYKCSGCGVERKMAKRMSYKKRGNPRFSCRRCRTTLDKWQESRVA